jgi:hypothetical protein
MSKMSNPKVWLAAVLLVAVFGTGYLAGANQFGKPNTIVHMITVKWKPESTPEQRQAAVAGVEKMAGQIPGIKNVWVKTRRVQPAGYDAAIAIEFENEAALKTYETHPAHKEWYDVYVPIRGESRTSQATND